MFEEWISAYATQEIMQMLASHRQRALESLGLGSTLADDASITAQHTAKVVGLLEGIDLMLDMEYGEIINSEEKQEDGEEAKQS